MKKPELKDFGLTEDLLDLNKRQRKEYYDKLDEYCDSIKKNKIFIIIFSLIITFGVLIVNIANEFKNEDAGIILGIFTFWDITVVFYCFDSLDTSVWEIGANKKDRIKAQTLDLKLDEAVENYDKAVSEYENYLKKCSIDFWNSLDGFAFEKEIAKLYRNQGYDAMVTPATADGGVDIILKKNGERIAVQCKHHTKPVGPNDVRALQGVVAAQNYSKGIFVSLNGYTSSVYYEVRSGSVKIELLELNDILQMAKENIGRVVPSPSTDSEEKLKRQLIKQLIIKLYQSWGAKDVELLLNKTVKHKKFGNGIIIFIEDHKYIDVYFPDIEEKKTFVFPNAFIDKHIVLVDFKIVKKTDCASLE